MPRILTVQWDQQRIRFAVAETDRRGSASLTAAGVTDVEAGDDPLSERIGQTLKGIVAEHKAEKTKVVIALARGSVDVAHLSLPMSEDAELPALVANMSTREIPGLTEDAPVDFIAAPAKPDGMRPVTVMALHNDDRLQIESVCSAAGVTPARISVAPYALAALIEKSENSPPTLLVSAGHGLAEILILKDDQPVVARTLRLPESDDARQQAEHIKPEVLRTLFSLPGEYIETTDLTRLVVFGDQERTTRFASELAVDFDIAAERIDPLTQLSSTPDEGPEMSGLAPLIGMILEEARGQQVPIDFANPKKPAPPVSRTPKIVAVVATLLLLVGGGWYFAWSQFNEIEQNNARLAARLAELKELNQKASKKRRLDKALTLWDTSRVSWLDELRDLTLRMPPSRDIKIQQLSIAPSSGGTFVATFNGTASNVATVETMELGLRDRWHQLRTPGVREQAQRRRGKDSAWSFQTTMTLKPRRSQQYVSHLNEEERAERITSQKTQADAEKKKRAR
jgi:hypothetical protein